MSEQLHGGRLPATGLISGKRFSRTSLYLSTALIALSGPAHAIDFTISTATTSTAYLSGGNTLTITPSGSILPPSGNFGVSLTGGNNTLDNQGLIETTGSNDHAIISSSSNNSPITNSGTVHTTGSSSFGIWLYSSSNSQVVNSGSIFTEGADAYGIYLFNLDNSPVTNSGYVVSARSYSFRFHTTTNSPLTLQAPSYIGGWLDFAWPTTVNIETGPSHSVFWTFGPNMTGDAPSSISGPVPWFYNSTTRQFATYDPTSFAGSFDALGDMTSLLSRLGQFGGGTSSGSSFGMDLAPGEAASTHAPSSDSGFWITGFGGSFDHDGDFMTLDRDIDQWGVAAGYRGQTSTGLEWGVMGGWLNSQLDVSSRWTKSYDIEGRGWFAGLNASQQFGAFAVDFGVTGGRIAFDQLRFVNDNLALTNGLTLGQSWADSSYDGWFVSPEIGISTQFTQSSGLIVKPSARIRYAGQWLDGYTETGSNANATVDERALGMVEASAEIELAKGIGFGTLSLRFGGLTRYSTGDDAVAITMLGVNNSVGFGDTESSAAYGGIGLDIDLASNTVLSLDATGYLGGDFTGGTGLAKLTARF